MKLKELIYEKAGGMFSLHPALSKNNYKLTNSFSDTNSWKAKVYLQNSGKVEIGKWDSVGYIWMSPKEDYIIPIARSDEHRVGGELLGHFKNKYDINFTGYLPIYPSETYIDKYTKIEVWKQVLAKAVSWGLDPSESLVNLYYVLNKNVTISVSTFLKKGINVSGEDHGMNMWGKSLVDIFKSISDTFLNLTPQNKSELSKIRNSIDSVYFPSSIPDENKKVKDLINTALEYVQEFEQGYISKEELEQELFGFNGFRNIFHNLLRVASEDPKKKEILDEKFGNIKKVIFAIGGI